MRRGFSSVAVVAFALAAGCQQPSPHGPLGDEELPALNHVESGNAKIYWRKDEIEALVSETAPVVSPSVPEIAGVFDDVRMRVERLFGLEPPAVEARLYLDRSIGQERYHVTQAYVVQDPLLRVIVPVFYLGDDTPASFLDRARGTIAHEVTEAMVITHVTKFAVLDPYLRWMHDGIAVYAEHAIEAQTDPDAAALKLARTIEQLTTKRQRRQVRWLDLSRWRQYSDFIIHSDVITHDQEKIQLVPPLERSLQPTAKAKNAEAADNVVLIYDAVDRLVSDAWRKEKAPFSEGEADPRPGHASGEELAFFYQASFSFWLEVERAHPGLIAHVLQTLARPDALQTPVVTGDEVARLVGKYAGEDVRPRLLRYRLDRVERVLREEIARLKARR
jgi:hypothetical protein